MDNERWFDVGVNLVGKRYRVVKDTLCGDRRDDIMYIVDVPFDCDVKPDGYILHVSKGDQLYFSIDGRYKGYNKSRDVAKWMRDFFTEDDAMMDRIARMYAHQVEHRRAYLERPEYAAEVPTKEARVRMLHTALCREASEYLDLFNWKPWKLKKKEFDKASALDEIADIVHFVLELAIEGGISADEIVEAYFAKSQVNTIRRQSGY